MITTDELFSENFEPAWLVKQKEELRDIQSKFLRFVFLIRYGDVETCFKCSRPRKFYPVQNRKAFSCTWCGYQIFPLSGTSLSKSSTPIKKWLDAAALLKDPKTPAMKIKNICHVTYKTAWRMKKVILDDFNSRGIIRAFIYEDLKINDELLVHYQFKFVNKR